MSASTAVSPATETTYVLFDSYMEATTSGTSKLVFRILPGQEDFLSKLVVPFEELVLTLDKAAVVRRPAGTINISDDFTFLTDEQIHINTFKPMILEGSPLPILSGLDEKMTDQINYLLKYMHGSETDGYGPDFATSIAEQYAAWGYEVNWEELLKRPEAEFLNPEEYITEAGSFLSELLKKHPCPPEEKYGFYIDPKVWAVLVRNRFKKRNTLITGPTGCGKTELIGIVCRELGQNLHIQDMGTVQDVQSSLIGVHRLDHEHKSVFDPAPFIHYVQSGDTVLMDEINRAPISAQNVVFPGLDSRRYIPVDIAGEGEERHVKLHEETWMVGTANLGHEYGGTQSIDRAFKDRFHIVELPYLKAEKEVEILIHRTSIPRKLAETIVALANLTRDDHRNSELSEAVSPRHTLATAEMVVDGFEMNDAIESVIYPLFENDGEDSERSKVIGMVAQF